MGKNNLLYKSIIADVLIGLGLGLVIIGVFSFISGYQIFSNDTYFTGSHSHRSDTTVTYIPDKYVLDYLHPVVKSYLKEKRREESGLSKKEVIKKEISNEQLSQKALLGQVNGNKSNRKIYLNIKAGMSSVEVAQLLSEKGLVEFDKFMNLIKILHLEKRIKAGNYIFTEDNKAIDIILKIIVP